MNRKVNIQDVGAGRQRVKVTMSSHPCEDKGLLSMGLRQQLLAAVVDQPILVVCGSEQWQKLRVYHDGNCWMIEAEATMDAPGGIVVPKAERDQQ